MRLVSFGRPKSTVRERLIEATVDQHRIWIIEFESQRVKDTLGEFDVSTALTCSCGWGVTLLPEANSEYQAGLHRESVVADMLDLLRLDGKGSAH